jgi:hypothetical protein
MHVSKEKVFSDPEPTISDRISTNDDGKARSISNAGLSICISSSIFKIDLESQLLKNVLKILLIISMRGLYLSYKYAPADRNCLVLVDGKVINRLTARGARCGGRE